MGLRQWNLIYKTTGHIPLLTARPHTCLNEYACMWEKIETEWGNITREISLVSNNKICMWAGFLVGTHIPLPKQQHIWYIWLHLNLNTVPDISIHALICFMYIICCIFPEFSYAFYLSKEKNRRENQEQLSSFILHRLQQQQDFLSWESTSQSGWKALSMGTCSKEQLQLDKHIHRNPIYYHNFLLNNFLEARLSLNTFPEYFEKTTIEKDQEEAYYHGSMWKSTEH